MGVNCISRANHIFPPHKYPSYQRSQVQMSPIIPCKNVKVPARTASNHLYNGQDYECNHISISHNTIKRHGRRKPHHCIPAEKIPSNNSVNITRVQRTHPSLIECQNCRDRLFKYYSSEFNKPGLILISHEIHSSKFIQDNHSHSSSLSVSSTWERLIIGRYHSNQHATNTTTLHNNYGQSK